MKNKFWTYPGAANRGIKISHSPEWSFYSARDITQKSIESWGSFPVNNKFLIKIQKNMWLLKFIKRMN